jgi:hypothetical protein
MPIALLQTQSNETVKISEATAWRMVYNVTTSREISVNHTTLKKLGYEEEKGQLREWMTDKSAWGQKVEYKLLLPPGSIANLRRH